MPNIATVGVAVSSGHDADSPVKAVGPAQSLVDVNGNLVQVVGGTYEPHGCPVHPTHTPVLTSGSGLVDINGIPVGIVGSQIGGGGCPSSHVVASGESLVDIAY